MRSVTQVFPIVVGITLCTASAALFYQWYRTRKSKRDELDGLSTVKFPKNRRTNETITLRPVIANDKVVLVSGRSGANVRSIEETAGVRIIFKQTTDTHQTCEITGPYENAMKAFSMINDELARSESVTEEMLIPYESLKSTGQSLGTMLKEICKTTNAKIHIDSGVKTSDGKRRIIFTGSQVNVDRAKQMIGEKCRQVADEQRTELKREPRISHRASPSLSSSECLSKSPGEFCGIFSILICKMNF